MERSILKGKEEKKRIKRTNRELAEAGKIVAVGKGKRKVPLNHGMGGCRGAEKRERKIEDSLEKISILRFDCCLCYISQSKVKIHVISITPVMSQGESFCTINGRIWNVIFFLLK